MIGEDREAAITSMDNDESFDRWMVKYQQSMRDKTRKPGSSPAGKRISQQTYLSKFAKHHGGEEEE